MNMKFLVFLGIITTVAAFHQECSLQSCTQHQPYVVDDPCPIHFYSKWYIRVGARKSAPLIELCVDEAGSKSPSAKLAKHIIENDMLNGEVIRLDGAIRLAPR